MKIHSWAEKMLKIVKNIDKKVDDSIHSQDGYYTKTSLAKKIIESFKNNKYKPYEQITDFWVIEFENDNNVGITVDFRKDMTDDATVAIVMFFNENM